MSLLLNLSRRLATSVSAAGPLPTAMRSAGNRFSSTSTHLQRYSAIVVCPGWSLNGAGERRNVHKFPTLQTSVPVRTFFRQSGSPSSSAEKKDGTAPACPAEEEPAKLGLFARFRKMYKEYWYVLVPVHCVTSVFWFGGFYYAATTGVDVIAALEYMGVSEKLIAPVRDSSLGHIATAYLLYKIATPARYTVTLGGTTVSIKYLSAWGYIKPIPTKAQMVQMYKDKKENIQERIAEKKQDLQDRKQQLQERKQSLMDDFSRKDKASDEK